MPNISVYKVRFPDGSETFEILNEDSGIVNADHLTGVAIIIRKRVTEMNQDRCMGVKVNLNFTPPADIQFPAKSVPRRCIRLTEQEQDAFWAILTEDPMEE